ncbi:MBL fold metallo-hydrolase [Yeosuana marina]|uniref:MBL fold metallo-hydrolase n=1 Tax=Yeosuana marina TaxID=1565536 RepID=UPI00141F9614|nr:MBL fold metallo-hydrolase [Yeosuana marina]
MQITTLIENKHTNDTLKAEHGLSLYIKTDSHNILFDTGQSNLFIQNAETLKIDLKEVDIVVISHAHYDHIGGLIDFLNLNTKAKVYLKKEIFDYQYVSIRENVKKNIGFSKKLLTYKDRFVCLDTDILTFDNLYFIPNINKIYPLPKGNDILYKQKYHTFYKDDFKHELIFAIKESNGIHLFSGCAHNGILNMVSTVKETIDDVSIKTIIGGFHLVAGNHFVKNETDQEITIIAKELKKLANGAHYYTGHCTSSSAFDKLSLTLGSDLQNLVMGHNIEV